MKFEDAFFEFAAGKLNQLPPSDVPEIVFSGKSNVGKSSLINKILNRKSLARVSATPGKTGTISQRIAMVIQDGDYMTAGIWVVIIMLVAFVLIFLMNLVTGRNMKNIRRW